MRAWKPLLFACIILSQGCVGSAPIRSLLSSLDRNRAVRRVTRYIRRRGLVKRGQCYIGSKPKTSAIAVNDTVNVYASSATSLSAAGPMGSATRTSSLQTGVNLAPFATPPSQSTSTTRTATSSSTTKTASSSGLQLLFSAEGSDFFSNFTFFNAADPTNGQVEYVDQSTAESNKLVKIQSDQALMSVDNVTTLSGTQGRKSVRIASGMTFTANQLLVMDASHMPFGCSVWPAFWTCGPDWPNGGEIDILEGVNQQTTNQMTLHTSDGCTLDNSTAGVATQVGGTVTTTDCYAYAGDNTGCSYTDTNLKSYGQGFNSNGGGVFATLWGSTGISMWFFERGSIPADLIAKTPNPSSWGKPSAFFGTSTCDLSTYFQPQQVIFDVTLCGAWAGAVFNSASSCQGTCSDYVADASHFDEAYWAVNYVRIYG